MPPTLRPRPVKSSDGSSKRLPDVAHEASKKQPSPQDHLVATTLYNRHAPLLFIAILSAFVTFYKIWNPSEVVFDEVHFVKLAGYYLKRTFFFDVHPPLGKLMIAGTGYLFGFDGHFELAHIGDSYLKHKVPYIGLRALPATLNVISAMLVYSIMETSCFSLSICILSATMYIFDNAIVTQNRLVSLDSILIVFMLTCVYAYIRFYKLRQTPFTIEWWIWLLVTGVFMAFTFSVKMIGLSIVALIGLAVIYDLWHLLDIKNGLTMSQFMKHFYARVFALFIVPISLYLFWFYIHFAILNESGPGDKFMSTRFQDTLKDSPLRMFALEVNYGNKITLKHKETNSFLHSHKFYYPLRYKDGRVSSAGQQVTGVMDPNDNCYWRIKPTNYNHDGFVRNGDVIQLEHIVTGTNLLAHDVASPWMPTNEEITTVPLDVRFEETLFKIEFDNDNQDILETHMTSFRLVHKDTQVSLWVHNKKLPQWGLGQLEVSGNKNFLENTNYWSVQEIRGKNATEINAQKAVKELGRMPFIKKFFELQSRMIYHNAGSTKPSFYQSTPIIWPFMTRGIFYWSKQETRSQIYLTGNIFGWYLSVGSVIIFTSIILVDILVRRRGIDFIGEPVRQRVIKPARFFFVAWVLYYFPFFFLMGGSLFIYNYLPALTLKYLLLGAMYQLILVEGIDSPVSFLCLKSKSTRYAAVLVTLGLQFGVFLFLASLTYGTTLV